jgi:NTE family protein
MRVAQAVRIFLQSMDISARSLTELRLEVDRPDVIIRPDVHKYGLLDTVSPKDLYRLGFDAAEISISDIHKTLSWPNKITRILRHQISGNKQTGLPDNIPSSPGPIQGDSR